MTEAVKGEEEVQLRLEESEGVGDGDTRGMLGGSVVTIGEVGGSVVTVGEVEDTSTIVHIMHTMIT